MAKSKDQIKRDDVKNSMLRRVIIRADFTPMLDLENTVSNINSQDWFSGKFNNYERRMLKVEPEEYEKAKEKGELDGLYLKRFNDCNIAPEKNVIFDISSKFIIIDIKCDKDYTKIDDYLQLFVKTLSYIITNDDYVKMTRLAIRKTDGMEFDTGAEADNVFEYFDQNIAIKELDKLYYRTYTDSFVYGEKLLKVIYNRTIRITGQEKSRFVFVLDIDTYLDEDMIENRRPNEETLWQLFFEKLNEASFELFKRSVKEDYLNSEMKA